MAFRRDASHFVTAAAQSQQNRITAASVVRSKPYGSAEARFVGCATGNGYDGSRGPAPIVEIVHEIPIEDMVKDRQCRRVAGTRADDQLLRELLSGLDQFDVAAMDAVLVKRFLLGEEELLNGVGGTQRRREWTRSAGTRATERPVEHAILDSNWPDDPFAAVDPLARKLS